MSRFALFAASFLAVISVAAGGAGGTRAGVPRLHVKGAQIVDGEGRTVRLRGVAFGNEVWGNVRVPRRHHAEVDYQRVAAMGMNAVRFYMNYRTFEPAAAPTSGSSSGSASRPASAATSGSANPPPADGWQWLDDNIAWARKNGVYLQGTVFWNATAQFGCALWVVDPTKGSESLRCPHRNVPPPVIAVPSVVAA